MSVLSFVGTNTLPFATVGETNFAIVPSVEPEFHNSVSVESKARTVPAAVAVKELVAGVTTHRIKFDAPLLDADI